MGSAVLSSFNEPTSFERPGRRAAHQCCVSAVFSGYSQLLCLFSVLLCGASVHVSIEKIFFQTHNQGSVSRAGQINTFSTRPAQAEQILCCIAALDDKHKIGYVPRATHIYMYMCCALFQNAAVLDDVCSAVHIYMYTCCALFQNGAVLDDV